MRNVLKAAGLALALAACNSPPTAPTVSISPTSPKTDADLKASIVSPATDPQGDAVSYSFAWLKNGAPQADLTSDTVPAAKTAKGETWAVVVTPTDGKLNGPTAKSEVSIANTAPTVSLAFDPTAPTKAGALKVVPTGTDADGDTVTYTYAWAKDGASTNFITDTIPADQLTHGQQWQATVTPNDGSESGQAASLSVTIGNTKPVVASVAITPASPTKATALSAAPAAPTDADSDVVSLKYVWSVNGAVVDGQTGPGLATNFFNKGQVVTVTVTPNDTKEDGTPVSANATVGNSAPTAPVATVTANPRDADDITCSISIASVDLDAADTVTYLFTWTKNGQPFSGATAQPTSSVVPATLTTDGDVFSCTVAATDGTVTTPGNVASTTVRNAFASCKAALTANPSAANGLYSIDPDGAGPVSPVALFCDMTNGGLTLVANIYDSAGDDAPNTTDYVVSGWQQTGNGTWANAATTVDRNSGGTGSAAVSLAFVAALKASAGQQNLKMCFVHQNGSETECRSSDAGSLTLISYGTGNPKLTTYSGNTLTYTYGRLAGLAGSTDGYVHSTFVIQGFPVPRTRGAWFDGMFGSCATCGIDAPEGLFEYPSTLHGWYGIWHGEGGGASYRPWETNDNELGGDAAQVGPNPTLNAYGFRLYVGP